jgi:hypothetical protein
MRCQYCQHDTPARGYCCERAELETLRAVVDEVSRHLEAEVSAQTMGALDVAESLVHVTERLRVARIAA